jgi:bifunctional DNase/RNase
MIPVRIAHAEPWPGRLPNGNVAVSHVIVVLADDEGRRALPIRLPGRDASFWRLLRPPEEPGEQNPEEPKEEMTGRLLGAAGITVTAVNIVELGPEVTAARVEFAAPAGTRHLMTRLADGLAFAVITSAPIKVADPVMDRLAEPVSGRDLLGPFLRRERATPPPPRHPRYEPRNLDFADGLDTWRFDGSFRREPTGTHWDDYSRTTEDHRAILASSGPEPYGFAFLIQQIFADDYRGQTVVFRGELRATDVADQAGLVLRVLGAGRLSPPRWAEQDQQGHRRDPTSHFAPVSGSHDWTRHEVTARIPDDGATIAFGIFLTGRGRIELRNAELESPAGDEPAGRDR